jgi:Pyruvate/2-oxoacid:ferredoxin oxidoreductase gamma subunit
MTKQTTIHTNEQESEEGTFLVNPKWIHLDEKEIQEKLDNREKRFRVNFEEIK